MQNHKILPLLSVLAMSLFAANAFAQKAPPRDQFFWLGEINKATAVINTDEGLLDKTKTPNIAAGIVKVLEDGAKPGAKRPFRVIEFEPLMIAAAGQEASLLHAGRSSQDMFATYRAAIMRENLLNLADQLNKTSESLVKLADEHKQTIVPNYTNGVAAQPNSWATCGWATPPDSSVMRSASAKPMRASIARRWAPRY